MPKFSRSKSKHSRKNFLNYNSKNNNIQKQIVRAENFFKIHHQYYVILCNKLLMELGLIPTIIFGEFVSFIRYGYKKYGKTLFINLDYLGKQFNLNLKEVLDNLIVLKDNNYVDFEEHKENQNLSLYEIKFKNGIIGLSDFLKGNEDLNDPYIIVCFHGSISNQLSNVYLYKKFIRMFNLDIGFVLSLLLSRMKVFLKKLKSLKTQIKGESVFCLLNSSDLELLDKIYPQNKWKEYFDFLKDNNYIDYSIKENQIKFILNYDKLEFILKNIDNNQFTKTQKIPPKKIN